MDNDATRYGKQTVHVAYGDATAINVGDMLLGYDYERLLLDDSFLEHSKENARYLSNTRYNDMIRTSSQTAQ